MSDKFKKVLFLYGKYIFCRIYQLALERERYEDCIIMKQIAEEGNFSLEYDKEEWITNFWRLGMSGETASANEDSYFEEAINLIGYEL